MHRSYYLLGWGYAVACAALVIRARGAEAANGGSSVYASPSVDAVEWFRRVKPYCNAVEVQTVQRSAAPPNTVAGAGFHAACFALAGRIDDARRIIDNLPPSDRY
jgi:hypothetical protein